MNKMDPQHFVWTACSTDTCAATCEHKPTWTAQITIEICNQDDPPKEVIKKVLQMMMPLLYEDFIKWLREERNGRASA